MRSGLGGSAPYGSPETLRQVREAVPSGEILPACIPLSCSAGEGLGEGASHALWPSQNSRSTRTTSLWSSSWGSPDTVTVPTTPAPLMVIGKAPPWGAYSRASSNDFSSIVVSRLL